jgi:hypothetical protein
VVVALCTDLDTARAASHAGATVVLVGADPGDLGRAVTALRHQGGGRVGIFVGDPADEAVWAAAGAMAAELYGEEGVRVNTVAEAEGLAVRASPPAAGSAGTGSTAPD